MGWADTRATTVSLAASASESARFGHPVERLSVGGGWASVLTREQLVARVRELIDGSTARTVILRYPSESTFLARDLAGHRRLVYPAGSLLYWERPTAGAVPDGDVELLHPDDAREASAVIAASFDGYVNHYHANPLIDEAVVTDGYLEWAASSITSTQNRVFVVRDGGAIAGVATVEAPAGASHWEILLAGIDPRAQGKGLYLTLVRGILAAAAAEGVELVVISTQSHNIAVQRAWAKLGFSPAATIETAHLVADT